VLALQARGRIGSYVFELLNQQRRIEKIDKKKEEG
jgi:hypothetical protein